MGKDPFGFDAVRIEENPGLDIEAFAPKPRPTNRAAADAVREVARNEGFTRRGPSKTSPLAVPLPDVKGRKRRVNITEILGIQDRYPETERAQLNMLAPVPIVLRWRKLVAERQVPAWETLEAAMEALEATRRKPGPATSSTGEGAFFTASSHEDPSGKALARSESR